MLEIRQTAIFTKWFEGLRDRSTRARIAVRLRRLEQGNAGQHRVLTEGVVELKVDIGPGYRVYYTQRGSELVVLLVGGDKSNQQRDIAQALQLAKEI
jgi:putative addiction module killer protein